MPNFNAGTYFINTEVSKLKIGEVYMMKFEGDGSVQTGWRPGVIVQNNVGNKHSPNVIALPLTTSLKNIGQPTHVVIKAYDSGIPRDSMVLCENPSTMCKENIGEFITELGEEYMNKIAKSYTLASSVISFLNIEELLGLWKRASALNS